MDSYLDIANSPVMWLVCAPVVLVVIAQALIFGKRAFQVAPSVGLEKKDCWAAIRSGTIATIGPAFSMFVVMVTLMANLGGPIAWQRLSIIGTASTEMLSATLGAQAAGTELGAANYDGIAFASSCWVICLNTLGWLMFNFFFAHRMERVKTRLERGDPKLVMIIGGAASFGGLSMLMLSQVAAVDTLVALLVSAVVTLALNKVGKTRPRIRELIMAVALVIGMVAGQVCGSILEWEEIEMEQKYTYEKDWNGGFVVKYGRLTTLLCAITSMFPVLYLWLGKGIIPSGSVILQGWISVASVWAVMYVLEPLSYYPMIGLSGVYLGYLAGNIPYVRIPAMLSAINVVGVGQTEEKKREIVGIFGMVASIFVNTGILMLAALLGTYILSVLPPVVLSCFNYALPAIVGSLCATVLGQKPKNAAVTILLAVVLVLVGVPTGLLFPASVFGAILLSVLAYKRKSKKQAEQAEK